MGQMTGFLLREGCEHKALWNLRYADMEVTALNWRKHSLGKITRISFFFPIFSVETRKEGFSSSHICPHTYIHSRRMCTSGSTLPGTGFWWWLVRQEVRRESSKGETASVHVGALQESCWWLYTWFAIVLSVSYVLHWTVLLLDLCSEALFVMTHNKQGEKLTAVFSHSFLNGSGLTWRCLKFRLCSSCFPAQYLCFSEYS